VDIRGAIHYHYPMTTTTYQRVIAAAESNGWLVSVSPAGDLHLSRDGVRAFVGFDKSGAVGEYGFQKPGELAARTFDGREKAGRLIARLSERKVRAGDVAVGDLLLSVQVRVAQRTLTDGVLTLVLEDGRKVVGANLDKLVTVR
jgi:hypothetical protein